MKTAPTSKKSSDIAIAKEAKEIIAFLKTNHKRMSMLEMSEKVVKLRDKYSIPAEEISLQTSLSTPHVYNLHRLSKATPKVRALIKSNQIKGTTVLELITRGITPQELEKKVEEKIIEERESLRSSQKAAALLSDNIVLTPKNRHAFEKGLRSLLQKFANKAIPSSTVKEIGHSILAATT